MDVAAAFQLDSQTDRDLILELSYLRRFRIILAEHQLDNIDETLLAIGANEPGDRDELRTVLTDKIETLKNRVLDEKTVFADEVDFIRGLMTA